MSESGGDDWGTIFTQAQKVATRAVFMLGNVYVSSILKHLWIAQCILQKLYHLLGVGVVELCNLNQISKYFIIQSLEIGASVNVELTKTASTRKFSTCENFRLVYRHQHVRTCNRAFDAWYWHSSIAEFASFFSVMSHWDVSCMSTGDTSTSGTPVCVHTQLYYT
jgi:hypothetical protein